MSSHQGPKWVLKPGDILEVFDGSRIMEGIGGQHFFVPGLKIGEIEIVSHHREQAGS